MNNGKILVIDGEVKICKILKSFLHMKGFDVKCANGGAEAKELLKTDEFDLVLCDYFMPTLRGEDVVKLLKELGKSTKTGLMTYQDELISNKERDEMRVGFIIEKPFDFTELEKCINEVINSR